MITITHGVDIYGNHWTTVHNPDPDPDRSNAALYYASLTPPNYPVPATLYDVEYDPEYIYLLHERARLIKELRDIRGDTNH